jgi:octopine/nopaline transport system substrate-binding protein
MHKVVLPLVGLLVAISGSQALSKEWTKVKIATEGAYAPWNFVEPSGKLAGYDVDVSNDLCARMKVECEIMAQDWDGIIPALNAGKYDAIVAAMVITDKRKEVVDFTVPYAVGARTFVTLKSSPLAKIPAEDKTLSLATQLDEVQKTVDALKPALQGKSVGVQTATTHAIFMEKYLKGVVEVHEYKTSEQMMLDLTAGRIDAAFDGIAFIGGSLRGPEGSKLALFGPKFDKGLFGIGSAIAVRKSDPELRDMFSKALDAAREDGTLSKLSIKWFTFDISPRGPGG